MRGLIADAPEASLAGEALLVCAMLRQVVSDARSANGYYAADAQQFLADEQAMTFCTSNDPHQRDVDWMRAIVAGTSYDQLCAHSPSPHVP